MTRDYTYYIMFINLKSSFKRFALFFIVAGFLLVGAKSVSADIVQDSVGSFATGVKFATGTGGITAPSALGSTDSEYYTFTGYWSDLSNSASVQRFYFDLGSIPANAVVDSIDFQVKLGNASFDSAMEIDDFHLKFTSVDSTATGCNVNTDLDTINGSPIWKSIHITANGASGDIDGCGSLSGMFSGLVAGLRDADEVNLGSGGYPVNAVVDDELQVLMWCSDTVTACDNSFVDIDSMLVYVNYSYDNTTVKSRVISGLLTSEYNATTQILTTGADLYGDVYSNSDDDYTQIQVKIHNFFTNQDLYLYQNITLFDQDFSYQFTDFCSTLCTNGDSYQLAIRLTNTAHTVFSSYLPTYYYFAYNARTDLNVGTTTLPVSTTTSPFTFATSTNSTSTLSLLQQVLALSPTVRAVNEYCKIFGDNFNFGGCIYYLILPTSDDISVFMTVVRNAVLSKIPFIGAFWTTSSTNIPVLTATIPSGIAGAGASITLDPNHSIDWLLNATSTFTGNSDTLYQTTSVYWDYFCYLLLGLYFLRRLMSMHLFKVDY